MGEIENIINNDLNPDKFNNGLAPTIIEDDLNYRHYELGNCFGLCAYNYLF